MGLLTLYYADQVQLNILDPDLVTVYPPTVTGTPTTTANPGGPAVNFDQVYNADNTYLNNISLLNTTGLVDTLNITNLDVENPGVSGGPNTDIVTVYPPLVTGTPTPTANPGGAPVNFSQPNLPSNTYLDTVGLGELMNTLDITNLDVENPGVNGGPLNDITTIYPPLTTGTPTPTANPGGAPQRFVQSYLPNNTYLDSNPIQGTGSLDNTLNITNLDVEDPGVQGGIPYKSINDPTIYPPSTNPSVKFNQKFTPKNTYTDFITPYIS